MGERRVGEEEHKERTYSQMRVWEHIEVWGQDSEILGAEASRNFGSEPPDWFWGAKPPDKGKNKGAKPLDKGKRRKASR